MDKITIPHELKKMNELFKAHGFEAYLVGGAVRDMILGKAVNDWDVTTNAEPEQVMSIFKKVIPTGIAHGTVTVHFLQKEIEVTTYRADQGYSDGRHPDKVVFAKTVEDDLSRRDFTMNAIAASLEDGTIKDPFEGRKDIKDRIIRTVGNPHERFMEDGLRPVRALRFASQLNFSIEKYTYSEISRPEIQKKIGSISMERFRDEFIKIMKSPLPSRGLKMMEETGVLSMFIPELACCRNVTQADSRGFHEYDILDHNFYACDGAPQNNVIVRIAALFHDLGKFDTRKCVMERVPGQKDKKVEVIHFLKHEIYSEKKSREILTRLKFSNADTDRICHLVKEHMFYYESSWTDAAVRRFIIRIGKDNFNDLFDLRLADIYGMHQIKVEADSPAARNLLELKKRIEKISKEESALSLKDMAVKGKDLIAAGISPGKKLGYILNELFQCVLDDPQMNNKEKLIEVALKINEKIKEV